MFSGFLLEKLKKLHLQLTRSDEDFAPQDDQYGQTSAPNSFKEVHVYITSFKALSQQRYLNLEHNMPIRKGA